MPHVIVKLWPGKTEQQKARLAEAIAQNVMQCLGSKAESVSVAMEEIPSTEWAAKVFRPDIEAHAEHLYVKPGYTAKDLP
jgi:4-oxalocrotonate tautomerase